MFIQLLVNVCSFACSFANVSIFFSLIFLSNYKNINYPKAGPDLQSTNQVAWSSHIRTPLKAMQLWLCFQRSSPTMITFHHLRFHLISLQFEESTIIRQARNRRLWSWSLFQTCASSIISSWFRSAVSYAIFALSRVLADSSPSEAYKRNQLHETRIPPKFQDQWSWQWGPCLPSKMERADIKTFSEEIITVADGIH